jgi:3-deoxy-manno-octulosonate cytidylyltransferase (CMP-KDO synthetase)
MDSAIVIPARLNSTRIREKLLIRVKGTEMVRLTYDNALKTGLPVYIVTDSKKIETLFPSDAVIYENPEVKVLNGTSRICRVIDRIPRQYTHLSLLQGDECFIGKDLICESLYTLRTLPIDTLSFHYRTEPLGSETSGIRIKLSPDRNYIVDAARSDYTDQGFNAIRTGPMSIHRDTFQKYNSLPDTVDQITRDIEWLKWLHHGYKIRVSECNVPHTSINTSSDLYKLN